MRAYGEEEVARTVSRARVARRIAAGAAYGGGSIGLIGAAGIGLLLAEVRMAKRSVGGGSRPGTAEWEWVVRAGLR